MDIIIERGKVVKLDSLPQYSIALDGFVQGPKIDSENHKYSFDHHGSCIRFCTQATCMQVWSAILLGLSPNQYNVYINDVDSDVCMSIWCLKNPDRCSEPLVKKLVNAVGLGDMFGGALVIQDMIKTIEWIAAPETNSRKNNDYEKLSEDGLISILESVLHRIDLYVNGEAAIEIDKIHLNNEFKIVKSESSYMVIESQDPHVLSKVFMSGIDRVVVSRPQKDGSISYTLAKRSDFIIDFPLPAIYAALNEVEPGWGGGSSIGGAPRNDDGTRSRLSVDQIVEIINNVLNSVDRPKKRKRTITKF